MKICFVDNLKIPVKDAVVSIASAPGSTKDIAMITDSSGCISFQVTEEGKYVFNIFYGEENHQVISNLQPGDTNTTLRID